MEKLTKWKSNGHFTGLCPPLAMKLYPIMWSRMVNSTTDGTGAKPAHGGTQNLPFWSNRLFLNCLRWKTFSLLPFYAGIIRKPCIALALTRSSIILFEHFSDYFRHKPECLFSDQEFLLIRALPVFRPSDSHAPLQKNTKFPTILLYNAI